MDTEKIRQEIETLQCPKHRKYPFLVFQPGNIKLTNVCCNEFEAELKDRIENLTVKGVNIPSGYPANNNPSINSG